MLGRALIARLPDYPITRLPDYPITRLPDHARKTRTAGWPCTPVVAYQSPFAAIARSSRDCFQIR